MKTLYWIDDTHDKSKPPNQAARRRLEAGLNVHLEVETISDREQFGKLLPAFVAAKTCGVIMDYQLTKVGEDGQMAFGTTWASEIRAAHPAVPVIGISHERECDIPKFRLESFLAFFQRDKLMGLNPPLKDIDALLRGYASVCRTLKKQYGKSGAELMANLINPPANVADLLKAAIPSALRGRWDEETPHVAGRWLWHEFQGLPGFLLDELGIATYLGFNLKGFDRVRSKCDTARYRGAFSSDERPRWWVGQVREVLRSVVTIPAGVPISGSREALLKSSGVKASERKTLLALPYGHRNSQEIPDSVAYKDDQRDESERVQALFNDTIVDERDVNSPFGFEARRVYAPRSRQ